MDNGAPFDPERKMREHQRRLTIELTEKLRPYVDQAELEEAVEAVVRVSAWYAGAWHDVLDRHRVAEARRTRS